MLRPRPSRSARRHAPQAIRRRARSRVRQNRLLDAAVLILLGLSLFYLARPAGASELPIEPRRPVAPSVQSAAPVEPLPPNTAHPDSIEPARSVAGRPAPEQTGLESAASPVRSPSLYELAAARYGLSPRLLRALHAVESGGAGDGCRENRAGSGAVGPFQFKPATFRAYAVDADGDGRPDICGFADSLFSAARYLAALGADADPVSPSTRRALARYGTDPALVVRLAAL